MNFLIDFFAEFPGDLSSKINDNWRLPKARMLVNISEVSPQKDMTHNIHGADIFIATFG